MSKLEQEVRGFSEECRAEESRYHYLNCMMGVLKQQQARIAEEMKSYVSHDAADKKKTLRSVNKPVLLPRLPISPPPFPPPHNHPPTSPLPPLLGSSGDI